jgi:ABC-type transporter Mla subunit MlaD
MMQFSDGVLGGAADMKALADVAATTGNDIGQVTGGVQKFMQAIAQGRNVTSASRELERMGVVSLEAREKMRQLQDQGASTEEMFAVLQQEINKFAGGVEADMDTGAAAFGRLRETGQAAMIDIGKSIMDKAAPALQGLGDIMSDNLDAGIIQDYVDAAVEAFQLLSKKLEPIFGLLIRGFKAVTGGIQDGIARIGGFIGAVQAGQGVREA